MTGRVMGGIVWGLAALVVLAGCGDREGAQAPGEGEAAQDTAAQLDPRILAALPPGTTPDRALNGRELFLRNCAACHGGNGGGTDLGPSLVADAWVHTTREVEQIVAIVRTGVANPGEYPVPMPRREGELNDEELRSLAIYVYALRGLQE
jgi:mono/diheme cytochrome c family protein